MPPNIDIYGLTVCRGRATIDRFLETYVDLSACAARVDDDDVAAWSELHARGQRVEWWPSLPVEHGVQRGLNDRRASLHMYLISKRTDIAHVLLCFTRDEKLIRSIRALLNIEH